nr:putative reverse transcriptase domain-containing protein [Tanacetum cinerariifolium]
PSTIQSVILKVRGLTDDAVRNGLFKRSSEKRKESGETSKQEDARSNNKRAMTGKGFVAADSCKKKYNGLHPKCNKCSYHQHETTLYRTCFNYNQLGHVAKDCQAIAKWVTLVNAINMMNNPRETNKIICGCTLVLKDVPFSIDLLPFKLGSFDVIVGMDWLSKLRAYIVFHKRVIHTPLLNDDALKVHGERSKENPKHLANMKANEKKLKYISIIRDFPKVFPDDLMGLPPLRPIEFPIDLVPEATHVAKALYCLAPSKKELSDQLKNSKTRDLFVQVIHPEEHPITQPLTLLTKKDKRLDWGEEQEKAFQTLKDALCSALILAIPDGPYDLVVYYDASGQGLGCVLMQRINVIAYASWQLKVHKKNYTTYDLELGVINTNHKSLQHIFNQKELNMRQRRWIELFNDYDYEICYHPGKVNVVGKILKAQIETFKEVNVQGKALQGLNKQMECKEDDTMYFVG